MADPVVRIAIAAHKPYWIPDDSMYVPVQAGADVAGETFAGFCSDAQGDGISALNPYYCELTVLYWAWKNLHADYVGLVHYRRFFSGSGERGVLTEREAIGLVAQAPVVVPRRRNYVVETVGSHYAHTHSSWHLDVLREAVGQCAPEYAALLEAALSRRRAHMFNMAIMRADVLDEYCCWLFPILLRADCLLEARGFYERAISAQDAFGQRAVGRLGELLLDVWLSGASVPYVECGVCNLEPVNWPKKGAAFLQAKFFGKGYKESF